MNVVEKGQIKVWVRYSLSVGLIMALVMGIIFAGISERNMSLIKDGLLATARTHYNNIVLTLRWNAIHSGVYVEKQGTTASNPYVKSPDIVATNGKVLARKNPADMTRELSQLAAKTGEYSFHIASLNPLDPQNTPYPFEVEMLNSFEKGKTEATRTVKHNEKTLFHFMAPLIVFTSWLH